MTKGGEIVRGISDYQPRDAGADVAVNKASMNEIPLGVDTGSRSKKQPKKITVKKLEIISLAGLIPINY